MTSSSTDDKSQLSPLPAVNRYITTHNEEGKAIFHPSTTAPWAALSPSTGFNLIYTTSSVPAELSNEGDIQKHKEASASGKLGFTCPGGSLLHFVDTAPMAAGETPFMHRTQTIDYGIVIMGEVELILDSRETRIMKPGDVVVQRATMHAWRNTSKTEWARMAFVQLEAEKVKIGGKELGEDLGVEGEAAEAMKALMHPPM
ncbi:MAG: hypothetical protein MMC33_000375 [Icmadophila ericetorum]|nr:hypothetical protein [Icmadophila ericetorum]